MKEVAAVALSAKLSQALQKAWHKAVTDPSRCEQHVEAVKQGWQALTGQLGQQV